MLHQLVAELSQATVVYSKTGKVLINKTPDGMKSPNKADALIIRLSRDKQRPMTISKEARMRFKR